MKKCKRITRIFFLVILVLAISLSTVVASTYGNTTAFCVGTNYGLFNINTTSDANYASNYYSGAGLYTTVSTMPTISLFNSANTYNGKKHLESGIVFLSGHGNWDRMGFNYMGLGGDYSVGVIASDNNRMENSRYYYGLGQFDLDDVAMYVFAGCLTASGSQNIAKWVVDNGANASIGWTTEVDAPSHSTWLSRFNSKICSNDGLIRYSIADACEYADSFSYLDNRVKNHIYYGSYNNNPIDSFSSIIISSNQFHKEERSIRYIEDVDKEEVLLKVESFLENEYGVFANEFQYEFTGDESNCIDCFYVHNLTRTNIAQTFIYEPNERVLCCYDNTNEHSVLLAKDRIDYFHSKKASFDINEASDYKKSIKDEIKVSDAFYYYDADIDCMFEVFSYTAVDNCDCIYSDTIMTPIEW